MLFSPQHPVSSAAIVLWHYVIFQVFLRFFGNLIHLGYLDILKSSKVLFNCRDTILLNFIHMKIKSLKFVAREVAPW